MSKIEQIRSDMMAALKAKDAPRKEALSLLLSALKAKEKDKRAPLSGEEENAIVQRELKQVRETMESAKGRRDIEDECKLRLELYAAYAPKQMEENEIRQAIKQVLGELGLPRPTAHDKGKVMRALMPRVGGKADGALVNRLVGEYLQ
ncbi:MULTISPECIES: GatB/YqeY domain-containing protein [Oscillospiraceae]|uniref:GatB/YqeY domain-containing protein n=1 Tax=Harryflintia acetispora TaxID=1849041 RepID=A0A9X8UIW0_9FIRM|nr:MULTISPECIES: GatB/YqeY domain-containing protein [Oscillospiraceae]TCL43154.1 hypothetical protein EDD78_10611 [Harryflintia acetispora]